MLRKSSEVCQSYKITAVSLSLEQKSYWVPAVGSETTVGQKNVFLNLNCPVFYATSFGGTSEHALFASSLFTQVAMVIHCTYFCRELRSPSHKKVALTPVFAFFASYWLQNASLHY